MEKKENKKKYITSNSAQTQKVAKEILSFAKKAETATLFALYGDLGSGKTTFTQGLAKEFGIVKRIISPTFVIVRTYMIKTSNYRRFYHIDLYRINTKLDLVELGIAEILNNPENIVVIEWAEKAEEILPKKRVDIYFKHIEEDKREIGVIFS